MKNFEVNGNLEEEKDFEIFSANIIKVMNIFTDTFGTDTMSKFDLYIDNATEKSGYTPIITVILKKYILIKLGIEDFSNEEQIIYQFSHELCHYVFYSLKGLDKPKADNIEENICSAMSLILIKKLYPHQINKWLIHVNNLTNKNYNNGGKIAESCEFDINVLKKQIYKLCNYDGEQNKMQ